MPREYAKIKDVYLRLYDYKFDHGPREENPTKKNPNFVGRKNIKKRIRLLFDPKRSRSEHGAYLVTGYRGMGKTSLVRESLSVFKKSGTVKTFDFFLSQDDVRDIDLLRQIGWKISDYVNQKILVKSKVNSFLAWLLSVLFFVFTFMGLLELFLGESINGKGLSGVKTQILEPYKVLKWSAFKAIVALLVCSNALLALIRCNVKEKAIEFGLLYVLTIVPGIYSLNLISQIYIDCGAVEKFVCNISTLILFSLLFQGIFALFFPGAPFLNRPYSNLTTTKYRKYLIKFLLIFLKLTLLASLLYQASRVFVIVYNFLLPNISKLFISESGLGRPILFFIILAFVFGAANTMMSKVLMFLPSYKLKKDLKNLLSDFESRLYANVTQEKSGAGPINIGSNNPLGILTGRILNYFQTEQRSVKNTLNYQVATTKEIEQFLFRILRKIDEIRSQYDMTGNGRKKIPKFVFIIDELDKVEPNYYFSPGDRETDQFMQQSDGSAMVITKARKRQEAIAKLLANLKSFLNNADAKFIFIGGRGMYDAALADIADRETFFSSIFNEVIYVPSFFRDSISRQSGLTELTEYFISQYLTKVEPPKFEAEQVGVSEMFKVFHTLQNFFIFCAYRSNGSPKKLIEIFEKYIVELDSDDIRKIKEKRSAFFYMPEGTKTKKELYLKFSYKNQYEINLTSNLYRPYLIIHSRHLKSLGDKLLYSSAFLMDHILKFHRSAFSFRNLELIPDIILANKDPNLRHFFQDIMNFLSKMHIRETVNAIYQHKFYSRVKNELKYVSRISEFSSAAYNFTLDESYHLKSYYKKKLGAKYKEYAAERNGLSYIHSIGYLHSLIGDLHYYDEEYDDAIIHYTDAIQPFTTKIAKQERLQSNEFVLYTRCKLVLGLCLEKLQSYDKAYSEYRSLVIESKNHGTPEIHLESNANQDNWELPFNRMQIFLRPHIALLNVIEKMRADGITFDNLTRNLQEYMDFLGMPGKKLFPIEDGELIPEYDSFEEQGSERSIYGGYQIPLLSTAKKRDKKRIVSLLTDYYSNVGDLLFFKNNIFFRLFYKGEFKEENTIAKINELLFVVENRTKNDGSNKGTSSQNQQAKSDQEVAKDTRGNKDYFPSASSYIYYIQSLRFFMIPYVENYRELYKEEYKTNPIDLKLLKSRSRMLDFFLKENHYAVLNATEQVVLANILSKLGNAVFSCIKHKSVEIEDVFLRALPKSVVDDSSHEIIELFKKVASAEVESQTDTNANASKTNESNGKFQIAPLSIERVISIYLLAYTFYKRSGRVHLASLQLKKILYLVRESNFGINMIPGSDGTGDIIKEKSLFENSDFGKFVLWVTNKILTGLTNITDVSNRAQIRKSRSVGLEKFSAINQDEITAIIYNNHSTAPDVREVVLLVETIKSNIIKGYKKHLVENSSIYINGSSPVSDMLVRVFELKFQSDLEYANLNDLFNFRGAVFKDLDVVNYKMEFGKLLMSKLDDLQDDAEKKVFLESVRHSINNGFFCLYETIRILNTYGVDYILNYSFLAATHYRLAKFSMFFESFLDRKEDLFVNMKIVDDLKKLVGDNFQNNSDPFYHFDKSILYNQKAREMHSGGASFQQHNRSMYSLDDDYNDEFVHFCASIERYRINIGSVRKSIDKAEIFLVKSFQRDYQYYLHA